MQIEYCLAVHKNTCKHSLELVGVENKSLKFGSISSSEWEVLCQHIVLEIRVHTYVTIRRLLSAVRTNCVASFRFTSKQQWGEPVNIRESHNHPHIDSFKRTGYIQGLCTPRVEATPIVIPHKSGTVQNATLLMVEVDDDRWSWNPRRWHEELS